MGKKPIKIFAALVITLFMAACSSRDEGPPITEQPTEFVPSVVTVGDEVYGPDEPGQMVNTDTATDGIVNTDTAINENVENMLETVAYYLDDAGRVVPLARTIEKTPGVARATLSLLVSDEQNSIEIARLGLKPVLPANTQIELDIRDGMARVDLQGVIQNDDAAEEAGMVSAIVETLTEFESVDSVQILINGMQMAKLPFGTPIEGPIARGDINLEGGVGDLSEAGRVKLFFGSEVGSMIVPVTRAVFSNADVDTAVVELIKGPKKESGLKPCLPVDCGLIGVTVDKGVASINFTKEFMDITQQSDGGRLALKALVLTCTQFKGINEVKLLVDGNEYDPGVATMASPQFVNEVDFLSNVVQPTNITVGADSISASNPANDTLAQSVIYVGDEVIID